MGSPHKCHVNTEMGVYERLEMLWCNWLLMTWLLINYISAGVSVCIHQWQIVVFNRRYRRILWWLYHSMKVSFTADCTKHVPEVWKTTRIISWSLLTNRKHCHKISSLVARFVGPTWGPSGADRTQVGPMLAPWTLLSGVKLEAARFGFRLFQSFWDLRGTSILPRCL